MKSKRLQQYEKSEKIKITINNLAKAFSALSLTGLNCAASIKNLSKSLDLAKVNWHSNKTQWEIFGYNLNKKLNELWFIK